MSERTTIGGTVYESIGSSSSNLLLKCNGTARIQWGNRLIDLIKNGKIASGDSSTQIYVISDESEIKSDGVYVLSKEESLQLLICKDDEQYNITNTDLYISAKTKQDITVEQRQQALENIGMYYNTLEEVQQAGIQNGLVYVLSDQTLYTIKDGAVTEFEAKLKTVTVEKEQQEGEVITSSVSIVLSVADYEYVLIGQGQILFKYSVIVDESASIESTNASTTAGYRLYVDAQGSHLDVDYINVRQGLPTTEYIEATYEQFYSMIVGSQLKPHKWYLITDYQNPWKLKKTKSGVRPILVRALTESSLYPEGKLFNDQRVVITYDPYYKQKIQIITEEPSENTVTIEAKGRITKMIDARNNSANFDFLNYDTDEDESIVLHISQDSPNLDASIFPIGSYNNTLIVNDLKGTVLDDNGLFIGDSRICFAFEDSIYAPESEQDGTEEALEATGNGSYEGEPVDEEIPTMSMHDNDIVCNGLILTRDCVNFSNNVISGITHNTPISTDIVNSTFGIISADTDIKCSFRNAVFKNITSCTFNSGRVDDVVVSTDLNNFTLSETTYPLLYDYSKSKEAYVLNGELHIIIKKEQTFFRGMIVMHAGNAPIPEGWGICDGRIEEYNGEKIQTPNLLGRFIKAVNTETDCKAGGNSEITISVDNLPSHTHTYEILVEDSKDINIHEGDDVLTTSIPRYTTKSTQTGAIGSGAAITIDPKHYGLIFIMKL